MSKDSEPESRPISVSELLARSQGSESSSSSRSRDGRGRRRAGRDGSFSVSELTGEIPKVADADPGRDEQPSPARPGQSEAAPSEPAQNQPVQTQPVQTPKAENPSASQADARSRGTGDGQKATDRPAGESARAQTRPAPDAPASPTDAGASFPRSANPVARRPEADQPVVDRPRPDQYATRPGNRTASGMPAYGQAPPLATRDFSSDAVARRMGQNPPRDAAPVDRESANAVTGIIPVVGETGGDLSVVESDDVVTYDLAEVDPHTDGPRERRDSGFSEVMDFDAYRNFADVEGDDRRSARGGARSGRDTGDKDSGKGIAGFARKLFGSKGKDKGRGTAVDESSAPDGRTDPGESHTDWAATAAAAATAGGTTAALASSQTDEHRTDDRFADDHPADDHPADDHPADDHPTGIIAPVAGPADGRPAHDHPADDHPSTADATDRADEDPVDLVKHDDAEDSPDAASVQDTTDLDETVDHGPEVPGHEGSVWTDRETADRNEVDRGPIDQEADRSADDQDGAGRDEDTRSPALAWLLIFGQAVAGLAVGVGLFWGFTELWRWNPYFALVLAVVVIFGIVTLSHVVRRTKDLPTTLLALGVGLLVTIGPLVLLAA
ncbi:hypothetical protein [Gordonia sp. 'Campus']|uniref:hypothetical protein n=1 Tax=Gordonia sp. 'Campus' TaxID=2915824 RepID=UPI001EE4ABDD|nr:hypothetical protein [Gordonia sp. 'Campus']